MFVSKRLSPAKIDALRRFQRKDIELMDSISATPFHPGYWNQVRLYEAITGVASNAHGVLLDVGCGGKPYEETFLPYVKTYLGMEYSPDSGYRENKADFCGDAMLLPIADNAIDTILCTEVLEHIPNPERVISEFHRILRVDGVVITTAPFFYPIHDARDYFRYSPDGLANIMERTGLDVESVKPLSGTAITLSLMINIYIFEIGFMWTKWLYPFGVIFRPILLLFCFAVNVLGRIFEVILPSRQMSFNHLTVARKRGTN